MEHLRNQSVERPQMLGVLADAVAAALPSSTPRRSDFITDVITVMMPFHFSKIPFDFNRIRPV